MPRSLAEFYRAQGREGEADPQALITGAAGASEGGLDEVPALNQQATEFFRQSKYTEAAAIAERTLALADSTLGKDHPDTITTIENLLIFYRAGGRNAETEPLLKRVIKTFERLGGKDHPGRLRLIGELADLYRAQGRFDEAEPLYKLIMEANGRMLGMQRADTHFSVYRLADLYQDQGRYAEAELLYERVLKAFEQMFGKDDLHTLGCATDLAETLSRSGA